MQEIIISENSSFSIRRDTVSVMKRVLPNDTDIFTRGVEEVVTQDELARLFGRGVPLRIKHGIDVTAPGLHIGHAASLWKIRALQEYGHRAVILLGDTTTAIGDPTGRSKTRPVLGEKEITANAAAIEKEVRSILLSGPGRFELHRSSEWYKKMSVPTFLSLLSRVTHARLIERDMFRARMEQKGEIFMHELVYPILQGYDSVMLKSDLTIIGSDQLFNEHMGRFLQERFGGTPQAIVSLKILPGLDGGEKMSKSLGNFIGLSDTPEDKFGKAMRLIDPLIIPYLTIYTDTPFHEIKKIETRLLEKGNPMDAKLFFAEALVRRYHGVASARKERGRFVARFSRKEIPRSLSSFTLPEHPRDIPELLARLKLAPSKSEARRLIVQGAVEINGVKIRDPNGKISGGKSILIRVGKRKLVRVSIPD